MDFFKFAQNLENYTSEQLLDDIQTAAEHNPYLKALQLQQWNEGQDSEGALLGRYSKATEIISEGRKKAGETFDINETGETRRNTELFGEQQGDDINWYFDAKSAAMPGLMERIGPRLLGLKQRNIELFGEILQDIAVEQLNDNLLIGL